MIYKYIFLIISLTTALCFSDQIEPKTLSFIYKNKEYFVDNYGLSDSIYKQSYKEWKEKSSEIISSMIYSFLKSNSKISDSLYLKLLISVIDLPDSRPPEQVVIRLSYRHDIDTLNWVRDALNFLIHKSALPVLRKYDDLIKSKLANCNEQEEQKLQLLSLLDLSNNEKKELLTRIDNIEYPPKEDSLKKELENEKAIVLELSKKRDPNRKDHYQRMQQIEQELRRIKIQRGKIGKETFLWMRARVGEEDAIGNLIKIFNTGDFNEKSKAVEPLCIVGTDTCIKTLLESFDKRILFFKRDETHGAYTGYCYSLRKKIIDNLARCFPNDDIFNLSKTSRLREGENHLSSEYEKEYAKIFSQWAKKVYNVDVNYSYKSSGPFTDGACTKKDAIDIIERHLERAKKQGDFYYKRAIKKYGDLLKELKKEQRKK